MLLHFADLLLNQADLLAGVFELSGDGRLSLRGDLRRAGDAVLQGFGDAFETLRNRLADGLDLSGALRLRLRDGEEVAAEFWLCAICRASQRMTMAKTTAAMSTAEFIDYYFTRTKKNSPPTWGAEKRKSITTGARGLERVGCGEKAAIRERLGGADAVKAAARLRQAGKTAALQKTRGQTFLAEFLVEVLRASPSHALRMTRFTRAYRASAYQASFRANWN